LLLPGVIAALLEIRPIGSRNVLATSNRIDVDAFLVQP
jgi:hypothetical protein